MKRKYELTEEQMSAIIEQYKNGYTVPQIIKNLNLPLKRYGVYYFLKKNNISFNRKLGNKHNMIGKQFGYLTVLDIVKNEKSTKSSPYRAICYCSNCGNNNFDVNPQSLIRKRTTSCGCSKDRYVKTTGKNSIQYTGYEELNGKYWGTIKKRAENRGYSICVDIKYAWDLYVKQNRKCALSGLSIEFAISNRKVCETTASLDRIDSTKGYVEGNVQWVHKHVNIMKNVFEQNYFIELCALIAKNCNKI